MTEKFEEVHGRDVIIRVRGDRCIHSRNCVLGRPDVFVPNTEGNWIHPDRASADAIAAIAENCPSGAITYQRLDNGETERPPLVNTMHVRENGPLAVHATLSIGDDAASFRATLCRCGQSRRKPLCDGSHVEAGFVATGEPARRPSQPLEQRNGTLVVTPLRNGPLLARGALEICSGTGRTLDRTVSVALCRCGASEDKPFCDGSHNRIGFSDQK